MSGLDDCYNVWDLRRLAQQRLPKGVFDYIDLGTEDLIAMRNNRHHLEHIKLLNKVLVDVSQIDTQQHIFNTTTALPLAIAPTGIAGVAWYEGELELAKAAAKAGIPFTLATGSNTPMEKIAAEAGGQLWYQLYLWRNKQLSYDLIKRVYQAGFKTLIWTVDIGLGANREHNKRNGFNLPYKLNSRSVLDMLCHPRWMAAVMGRYLLTSGMPRHANYPPQFQDKITGKALTDKALRADQVSYQDIDRLRDLWPGTLIIKGIMRADDAERCVEHGADGIIVSNHGGRNMDSAPSPLDVLPSIVAAVGERTNVIVDSGVRRGSDIVKCLALGAKLVLTGRATLYGVSAGGCKGATKALGFLEDELRRTMSYIGARSLAEITGDCLWKG
jgi:isopentenyl diphosphate isomerase/L-lactate dehydrogenase-like FMN-dependent dehydrogenase